jgi:hypothetical protein
MPFPAAATADADAVSIRAARPMRWKLSPDTEPCTALGSPCAVSQNATLGMREDLIPYPLLSPRTRKRFTQPTVSRFPYV